MLKRRTLILALLFAALMVTATTGCALSQLLGRQAPPPTPTFTKTPKPTFTNTPDTQSQMPSPSNPMPVPGSQDTPVVQVVNTPAPVVPPTDTPVPPTPTPEAAQAIVKVDSLNVRSGPGTTYGRIGQIRSGQEFDIVGRVQGGSWVKICCLQTQEGWVSADYVRIRGDLPSVALVTDLPPTSTPRPTPRPTNTPPPPPPTAPPAPAKPRYEFSKAIVQSCAPNGGTTYIKGTVYRNRQPANGYRVVFSWQPDGNWTTQPVQSGPHEGYPGWNAGYYSHIIQAGGAREGTWYVWIVNEAGGRISEMATFSTDGSVHSSSCQEVVVDFDTN
jgi:hypothetical protein